MFVRGKYIGQKSLLPGSTEWIGGLSICFSLRRGGGGVVIINNSIIPRTRCWLEKGNKLLLLPLLLLLYCCNNDNGMHDDQFLFLTYYDMHASALSCDYSSRFSEVFCCFFCGILAIRNEKTVF